MTSGYIMTCYTMTSYTMTYRWMRCWAVVFLSLWVFDAHARETLRVLTWPGYADDDLVQIFEQRHNIDVEVTFITTDDALWNRLNSGNNSNNRYDVFAANTAELSRYVRHGISRPLDLQQIPNTQRQLPRFRDLNAIPGIVNAGEVHAIPFTYSEMGLIYNRKLVSIPPDSIQALWNPEYQGKVLAYDGSNHNFSLASQALGLANPFQIPEASWPAASQKLVALRRNVLTFYSQPEEVVDWFKKAQIAIVFANYGTQQVKQLIDEGADIGYTLPKEGALAWLDCWVTLRDTRVPILAHAWINYMLEPAISRALIERQGLNNTTQTSKNSYGQEKLIWLQPVEDFDRRTQLWNSIRSGDTLQ